MTLSPARVEELIDIYDFFAQQSGHQNDVDVVVCMRELLAILHKLAEAREALAGLVRVCEDTVVEDYPEYEIAQVELLHLAGNAEGE